MPEQEDVTVEAYGTVTPPPEPAAEADASDEEE